MQDVAREAVRDDTGIHDKAATNDEAYSLVIGVAEGQRDDVAQIAPVLERGTRQRR
jgi:hypothetical protein